jgi:predicted DNA-binding transcriptional regulator AlpA
MRFFYLRRAMATGREIDGNHHLNVDRHLHGVTLLKVKQVADLLGVHPRTIWQLAGAGRIPQPIRLGPQIVRWRLTDLQRHLQEMKAG